MRYGFVIRDTAKIFRDLHEWHVDMGRKKEEKLSLLAMLNIENTSAVKLTGGEDCT